MYMNSAVVLSSLETIFSSGGPTATLKTNVY